jgi:predicted O-linked N-acetylglucosamine transferase (SPINDLY family)
MQFQKYADRWRNTVGISDDHLADQIRKDEIDILVDLKLHTSGNRLLVFARKPAPVQVSWLGYPGPSGVETIGYRFTDPYLEPGGAAVMPWEQAVALPNCFWCYDPLTSEPPLNALPALSTGHFTFGCLNNFCKVNDGVLALWSKVLVSMPNARLLLRAPDGTARRHARHQLHGGGFDASHVAFVGTLPRQAYLQLYHQIDLCLDTFYCSGHTTSLDSLWMGVPIITLVGPTAMGRATWSQLSNLGLQELAAKTEEQFVAVATELARDVHRLAELRKTIRHRMQSNPLMDAAHFAGDVERAYRKIWREWCAAHK